MAEEEDKSSLEAKFDAAVRVIRSLPEDGPYQPSDDMMLMFYSYYKQATLGPCNIPRPAGFWDSRGKAKWDAWSSLGNMTKEEAMKNYIEDIQLILETIPVSEEVSDLVEKLDSFYTEVEGGGEEDGENEVDKKPFTRPFARQSERSSPNPVLLGLQGRRWRSDERGSSCSLEPSFSSVTNGTHSSLNSEVEEEELVCSIEPRVEKSYRHLNGHLSDHSNAISEENYRPTDSDNEEFCDSMEHLAIEEGLGTSKVYSSGSRGASAKRKNHIWDETKMALKLNREDVPVLEGPLLKLELSTTQASSSLSKRGIGSQSPTVPCGSQLCVNVEAACCCASQSRHSWSIDRGNINEQIANALLRLQDDMANVLHRLHTLEVLTVSQSRSPSPRQEDTLRLARKSGL
ncbi:acyl-CoA-binding domain-containing protein 5A-like isoform X2 [Lampris incognitus]|uniref:acyl-CoA-binding domain-containing protein 5A-like isoform X2 n=1 Tax=Lampris incognitus TaxID=2546036 RepID=UPI0024B5F6FF|nr:acyl-CoA-binding domain-containing protein 5A-like isoform X2 [Lampris incognitus]